MRLPPGGVVIGDQVGRREIGDGGAHDGDVLGSVGGRLRGGGRDGEDQIVAVAYQLAGDGLARRLVVLGVLLVDGVVDAGIIQGLHKTLVGGVERGVLGKLQHADLIGGVGGTGRAGVLGRRVAACGERERGECRGSDCGTLLNEADSLHGDHPFR